MTKTIELAPPLSKPLSWEELCILIGEGSPESLAKLGRSSAQLVEYGAFLHQACSQCGAHAR